MARNASPPTFRKEPPQSEEKSVHLWVMIDRQTVDRIFAAADIVVSRAGAGTISELCAVGKATIFVPSPNVTEDHQTHNAMALVDQDAASLVCDDRAATDLLPAIEELLADRQRIAELERNILRLARPDAAAVIAGEVLALIK